MLFSRDPRRKPTFFNGFGYGVTVRGGLGMDLGAPELGDLVVRHPRRCRQGFANGGVTRLVPEVSGGTLLENSNPPTVANPPPPRAQEREKQDARQGH